MPISLLSKMQRLITCLFILGFVPPCLCVRWSVRTQNKTYNVIDYGAHGDGKLDDSGVLVFHELFFLFLCLNLVLFI